MSDYNENSRGPINEETKNSGEEYRRPPYMRNEGRQESTYTSDSYGANQGGEERYAYTSRNTQSSYGQPPKKKGGGKIVALVVVIALLLGGAIGGACMMLGNYTNRTAAAMGTEAVVTEEMLEEVQGTEAELTAEQTETAVAAEEPAGTEAAELTAEQTETAVAAEEPAGTEAAELTAEQTETAVAAEEPAGTEAEAAELTAEQTETAVAAAEPVGTEVAAAELTAEQTETAVAAEGPVGTEVAAAELTAEQTETTVMAVEAAAAETGMTDEVSGEAETDTGAVRAVAEADTENDVLAAGSGSAAIATAPAAEAPAVVTMDVSDVVENAMPSVVAITTKAIYERYSRNDFDPFYYYFYGYGYGDQGGQSNQYEVTGAGSGIIIGDDGEELWIVTNNHVVEDAESLTVSFIDGTTASAYIKGTDSKNDLAVVGIALSELSDSTRQAVAAIQMGDSDTLRLGETTIAIGNALGLGQSVSTGVVSAVNREITTSAGTTLTTIQTDAAINPGNSGGALLNAKGELIGINVAKDAETDVEGMGYAIPISNARAVIDKLTTMSKREAVSEDQYPYLGVQLNEVSSEVAQTYGMPQGVMVYSLVENGPAQQAGVLERDIITGFDGFDVTTYNDLTELMQYYPGGTTINLTVQRQERGQFTEIELPVTLGLKSDYETAPAEQENGGAQDDAPGAEGGDSQQPGQGQLPGQQDNTSGWGGFKFGH